MHPGDKGSTPSVYSGGMNASTSPEQQALRHDDALAERRARVVQALKQVLPAHAVLSSSENTTPYECDGLTAYRQRPMCVALPETYEQVQDRKSTRLNSSHEWISRMPSSA